MFQANHDQKCCSRANLLVQERLPAERHAQNESNSHTSPPGIKAGAEDRVLGLVKAGNRMA